jgi:hypothetical protein
LGVCRAAQDDIVRGAEGGIACRLKLTAADKDIAAGGRDGEVAAGIQRAAGHGVAHGVLFRA